jgi:hypothetical protein
MPTFMKRISPKNNRDSVAGRGVMNCYCDFFMRFLPADYAAVLCMISSVALLYTGVFAMALEEPKLPIWNRSENPIVANAQRTTVNILLFDLAGADDSKSLLKALPATDVRTNKNYGTKQVVLPLGGKLLRVVKSSKTADVAFFPDISTIENKRSVQDVGVSFDKTITGIGLRSLQATITSSETYVPIGRLVNSCPFIPTIGFRFKAGKDEAWWLVSEFCVTGMLAKKDDNWLEIRSVEIRPAALETLNSLARN